jgi:thiosulfate dehydrogenase (quinone) large subunit
MAVHVSDLRRPAAPGTSTRSAVEAPSAPPPVWALLRILLGLIFLWPFMDKLFALGYSTGRAPNGTIDRFGPAAWLNGGHPTKGFLSRTSGPFADVYQSMAGHPVVDWLFMLCLLGVGVALVLGVALRPAAIAGGTLMVLIRVAIWSPENNPLIDEHVIYVLLLAALAMADAGRRWGLGRRWQSLPIVKRLRILA